jgi:hypothetical protein
LNANRNTAFSSGSEIDVDTVSDSMRIVFSSNKIMLRAQVEGALLANTRQLAILGSTLPMGGHK